MGAFQQHFVRRLAARDGCVPLTHAPRLGLSRRGDPYSQPNGQDEESLDGFKRFFGANERWNG